MSGSGPSNEHTNSAMSSGAKHEDKENGIGPQDSPQKPKAKSSRRKGADDDSKKRRCISSACVPCRRRKSKCDGTIPACSACAAVYNTECRYDPASDHRRKGVYKRDIDNLKTRNSTLQTLIQAILNYPEEEVPALIQQIRTCESLDTVAEGIMAKENAQEEDGEEDVEGVSPISPVEPTFESHLSAKVGEMFLDDGSMRYIGGTSVLLNVGPDRTFMSDTTEDRYVGHIAAGEGWLTSWTRVTQDGDLIKHLLQMYFTWHYTFFTTLSKSLFYRDFRLGFSPDSPRQSQYCSPVLVNAMLALGCHFTSLPGSRAVKDDSTTAGDHFFKEAKRLILEGDLHEKPRLATVQALALMSVREAGCGREAKGWVYSGMSFRMACDLGLNLDSGSMDGTRQEDEEEDARRITFWGCFLFDKCWSNYLGRLPQLPQSIITVPKFDVFPDEDAATWSAYTDSGNSQAHAQPARTRAVALQISALCEISADLMKYFYNPIDMDKAKGKQSELKKLSEIHQRLETWRRELPKEFEPKEGGLPNMLVMHMFFQLLYIHLFRPFLKYTQATSPLPANVSPRKLCTQAAATISKLLRLYKRSHGLRQICNIAVYIAHSACTIHLLNLPDKIARRDIIHGVKHLEEIAEGWLCARRTLGILNVLAKKWNVDLPDEAAAVLLRAENKFGSYERRGSTPASSPHTIIQDMPPLPVQQTSPTQPHYHMAMQQAQIAPQFHPPSSSLPMYNPQAQLYNNRPSSRHSQSSVAQDFPFSARPQRFPSHSHANTTLAHPQNPISPYQHLHSAAPTPSSTALSSPAPPSAPPSAPPAAAGADSPSALGFGGIEQLLREGQNWAYQDQMSLASGFENWAGIEGMAGVAGVYGGAQQVQGGQVQSQAQQHGQTQIGRQTALGSPVAFSAAGVTGSMNGGAVQMVGNGPSTAGGAANFGLGNIAGFAEDEMSWYQ